MSEDSIQVCTFRCGSRRFGIALIDIKEVAIVSEFTRVPHTPPEIRGLVNIRGQIILALDLNRLLGIPSAESSLTSHPVSIPDRRLIIFKSTAGPSFGIVVEDIGEIVTCVESEMEDLTRVDSALPLHDDRSQLVRCTCNVADGLLILLEPRRFLPLVETWLQTQTHATRHPVLVSP